MTYRKVFVYREYKEFKNTTKETERDSLLKKELVSYT